MLTVFVAHTAELAVRILQEKRGVPVATIVLQPWLLRSMVECAGQPPDTHHMLLGSFTTAFNPTPNPRPVRTNMAART